MPINSFASYVVGPIPFGDTEQTSAHTVLARPAPDTEKEVARMIENKTWTMAQTPSGFVMPGSAAAFGTGSGTATGATVCTAPTYVERDRHVAGIALAQASRPGSSAWSPPTC
jgi:hypothetical protein